jgi:hypothetical protein
MNVIFITLLFIFIQQHFHLMEVLLSDQLNYFVSYKCHHICYNRYMNRCTYVYVDLYLLFGDSYWIIMYRGVRFLKRCAIISTIYRFKMWHESNTKYRHL